MRNIVFIAIFILFFALFQQAKAEPMGGNELLEFCSSKEEKFIHRCGGYIQGIIDYHNLATSLGTAPTVQFCVPAKASLTELILVVSRYLKNNDHHESFVAAPAVALALFERYPCAQSNQSGKR